jgi:hypothetical protein
MSSDKPEFRPIEAAPARRALPYALAGVFAVVAAIGWISRRNAAAPDVRPVVASNVAPKPAAPTVAPPALGGNSDEAKAQTAGKPALLPAKAPEGPNVLGGAVSAAAGSAVSAAGKLATVARAELDRELAKTHGAQKQVAAYKKQVEDLTKQLTEARAQLAAVQRAKQPPPPSDQEQILQMLAPVLRTASDGRP